MQQYSSLPEQNSQLNANSSTVLTTMEQLRAELWLERSLNQLQSQLNDCLTLALTKDKQPDVAQAQIFQTVVNELKIAIDSSTLGLAIPQPEENFCKICYISSHSTIHSQSSALATMVGKDKKLQLRLNSQIQVEAV